MSLETILSEVERWPIDDQIKLVHEICNRLSDQNHELELTDELKIELDRRIDDLERDPDSGMPWEVVKARILERLRK